MITALLVATRDIIRTELKLNPEDCIIQEDGMPTPTCGPLFVAIHGSSWAPDIIDQNLGIDERADLTITVTMRASATPFDVRGDEIYVTDSLNIEKHVHRIKCRVHQNYTLITNANALLGGTDNIMEPLRWLGGDAQPQKVDNTWFSSEMPLEFAGITMVIRFGQARRMQTLTNIT